MRLGSICCWPSPPIRYCFTLTARTAPSCFTVTTSSSSAHPTTTSLPLGSCCRRIATSSNTALHSLSTRDGFLGLLNWHSLITVSLITSTGGGSGSTLTLATQLPLRPRTSVTAMVTLMGPDWTSLVSSVAEELNWPTCCPALLVPSCRAPSLAENLRVSILRRSGLLA